jgi:transposase
MLRCFQIVIAFRVGFERGLRNEKRFDLPSTDNSCAIEPDRVKSLPERIPTRLRARQHPGMTHITGHDHCQTLLLPESLDDYVGAENPVRFIEGFVDSLDLAAAGFARVHSKETGRPGYAPADLLKLYIYGYLNRVRSSRWLETETHRNMEVIWLLRHLKPDFKTIADFRSDNCYAFRPIFRQFVLLCRQLNLYGRELLAVDGTRIKAVNNKDRNFTHASLTQFINLADAKLEDYL